MADMHERIITVLVDAKGMVLRTRDSIYAVSPGYVRLREQRAKELELTLPELLAREVAPPPFTFKNLTKTV